MIIIFCIQLYLILLYIHRYLILPFLTIMVYVYAINLYTKMHFKVILKKTV